MIELWAYTILQLRYKRTRSICARLDIIYPHEYNEYVKFFK